MELIAKLLRNPIISYNKGKSGSFSFGAQEYRSAHLRDIENMFKK